MKVYIVGSMRNPKVVELGNRLRSEGYDAFEEWYAPGKEADDEWQKYEKKRGRSYKEALAGFHARNVYQFDLHHLRTAVAGVLVLPAGRSAHMELGYLIGLGKPAYVLFDAEPERFDVMYALATNICFGVEELLADLRKLK